MALVKATKSQAKLRMAISGPAGSGKTFTALALAKAMGGKVGLGDTERSSASKYANLFSFDTESIVAPYHPNKLIASLEEAAKAGYSTYIIDSLSHFWFGTGGVLEIVDDVAAKERAEGRGGNSFTAWKKGTPIQNKLVDAILSSPMHIIATMRSKTEWVLEENERGKKVPRKIGTTSIQRDGLEYEFDIHGMMDVDHKFIVDKTRCPVIADRVFDKPGADLAKILTDWLSDGVAVPAFKADAPTAPQGTTPSSEPSPEDVALAVGRETIQGTKDFSSVGSALKKQLAQLPENVAKGIRETLMKEYTEEKARRGA